MMVLWLLMLRGIGIELRHHIDHEMWRSLWDFVFSGASLLLALFLGVALANVIRGVPLDAGRQFFEPLWTDFRVGPNTGILDWYTVIAGIVAVVALSIHGAHFIAAKTTGPINQRAPSVASAGWWMLVVVTGVSLVATFYVKPQIRESFQLRPWLVFFPGIAIISLGAMKYFQRAHREWPAFYSSAGYLAGMLLGGAGGLYPVLLPAISDPAMDLTIYNSQAGEYGLRVGTIWWSIGMVLAIAYFIYVYRSIRGKVTVEPSEGSGIRGQGSGIRG
jgi:cytochrome bd ubiquinol oxidase subunit II